MDSKPEDYVQQTYISIFYIFIISLLSSIMWSREKLYHRGCRLEQGEKGWQSFHCYSHCSLGKSFFRVLNPKTKNYFLK